MNDKKNSNPPFPGLPDGTVTFLFTDIEGSTRLLKQLGETYAHVLDDHRVILRKIIERWGGREVDTQGDSFFIVFPSPGNAIEAAVETQRALHNHEWQGDVRVRVRMGLHTGKPWVTEGGFVGIDVHRAARIGHIGHGGQVLLSETTTSLVQGNLPQGVKLRDLGEYMLKDIQRPEMVSQLLITGLPSEFPALKSLTAWPNNLPAQPTPFIGRKEELADLDELFANPDVRLVTIAGAGGMGKTRLALEAGEKQLFSWTSSNGREELRFPNGVFFVPLASLDSPDLLLSTIAKAVNFQFYQGVEPRKQLLDFFREKQLLLIMDNYEHLLEGAEILAEILQEAQRVKALATSRQRLNLRAEIVYTLGGMAFPEWEFPGDAVRSHVEDKYSAMNLFMQAALRTDPDLEFRSADRRYIARICGLVEGLPLGLELAASWVKALSLEEIAEEVQMSLDFLEGEMRDAPKRHHSIRAVFDHSWKMLDQAEQEVFKKLSVFRGGFNRRAAQHVAGATLQQLLALVSKSLIRRSQTRRYEIHELLRQYGAGKLDEAPEEREKVNILHCEYYAGFLQHKEAAITGGDTSEALMEMDNIRVGWRWTIRCEMVPEIRKQMLSLFWLYEIQGWYREAEATFEWAANALRMEEPVGDKGIVFGYMLAHLALFSTRVGQYEKGFQFIRESRAILRQLGARQEIAHANMLAFHLDSITDYEEQKHLLNESLLTYKELGIRWGMVNALMYLGLISLAHKEYETAEQYFLEELKISRETNYRRGICWSLMGLGKITQGLKQFAKTQKFFEDALAISKEIGYQFTVFLNLCDLGTNAFLMEDYETAQKNFEEAFGLGEGVGNQVWMAESIDSLGDVALAMGKLEEAKELYKEALAKYQDLSHQLGIGSVLSGFGNFSLALDNYQEARDKYQAALEIGVDARDMELCGEVLGGLAALLEATGEAERAVELAALAVSHPNISALHREKSMKLLDELGASLPSEVFTSAQERGMAQDLETTAKELLTELGE